MSRLFVDSFDSTIRERRRPSVRHHNPVADAASVRGDISARNRADAGCVGHDVRSLGPLAILIAVLAVCSATLAHAAEKPDHSKVPGVVVDHLPASTGRYVGSPSIAILSDGDYVASHDVFGPKSGYRQRATTRVFRSSDKGKTWRHVSDIDGQLWSTLFVHRGDLYIIGTLARYNDTIIRRSTDGGKTWTEPENDQTGLLLKGRFHCAPVPAIVHDGRLWRAMEDTTNPLRWGLPFRAFMMSARVDADLLKAKSWTVSNRLAGDAEWLDGRFGGWLEGNAVVTPDGHVVDILRVDDRKVGAKAAVVQVSDDGKTASFDPDTGFIDFPGANTKFTIRFDPESGCYWSLSNYVPPRHEGRNKGSTRNTLALIRSRDLKSWEVRCILLYHPDVEKHGFQYPDWQFDGNDIIAASRTAYDDGLGGAHNFHDANYLTFHRVRDFRKLTMADSVINAEELRHPPKTTFETPAFTIEGHGFRVAKFDDDALSYGNRRYVWKEVPERFRGWKYTQTNGGERADIALKAKQDTVVYVATAASQTGINMTGWEPIPGLGFYYTDRGRSRLTVLRRHVKAGELVVIPQGNWSGGLVLIPSANAPAPVGFERLRYNNPGLVVDLGVGLWAWPLPMDFDGDGDLDLVVSCSDVPFNGTYFFENPGGGKWPVFKPAVRVGPGLGNACPSYIECKVRVLLPGHELTDFRKTGFSQREKIFPTSRIHEGKTRANQWKYADYDGNGVLDLIVGVGDWTDYGWDNAFDAEGHWTRGPLHGYVYVIRNKGTTEKPDYAEPVKISAGDEPVDVYGMPSPNLADFDGDGDLDLLCGEFVDGFTYFQNTGTRTKPAYVAGRKLMLDGKPLVMDLCMIVPVAIDWDKDGDVDLVVGQEDGRVALLEHTGKFSDGLPVFAEPQFFRQQADCVKFGALVTPVSCDWDGDGDEDLICGNTAGHVGFIENLGKARDSKTPRWASPVRLKAGGKTLRIMAGYNGSIQGPCEAKWGYTTLSVADWDHDGLLDLIVNSIWGKVLWYRNIGAAGKPQLAGAQPIEVERNGPPPKPAWNWWSPVGKELATQWRTTPLVIDLNSDGLNDLVMLDHEGYLAFFERKKVGGKLTLSAPQRIFRSASDKPGEPMRLNNGVAGRSGRRKLCFADWDGDGQLDLLANSRSVNFLRNVSTTDSPRTFRDEGPVDEQRLAGHTTSPTVVDWDGNGGADLLVGAEDGFLYYLRNPHAAEAKKP